MFPRSGGLLRCLPMLRLESANQLCALSRDGSLPTEFETGTTVASRQHTKAITVLVPDHFVRSQRLWSGLVPDRCALLGLDRSQLGSFQTRRPASSIRNS